MNHRHANNIQLLSLFTFLTVSVLFQSVNQSNLFKVDQKIQEVVQEQTNKRLMFLIKIEYTKNLFL